MYIIIQSCFGHRCKLRPSKLLLVRTKDQYIVCDTAYHEIVEDLNIEILNLLKSQTSTPKMPIIHVIYAQRCHDKYSLFTLYNVYSSKKTYQARSIYEIHNRESPILFLALSTEITLTSTLCPTCGFGPCPI